MNSCSRLKAAMISFHLHLFSLFSCALSLIRFLPALFLPSLYILSTSFSTILQLASGFLKQIQRVYDSLFTYLLFFRYRRHDQRRRRQLAVWSWSSDLIALKTPFAAGKSRCLYNLFKWSIFLLHQWLCKRVIVCRGVSFGLRVLVIPL